MTLEEILKDRIIVHQKDASNHLEIGKLFSSFANTNGGKVLFGIRENGKLIGVNPVDVIADIDFSLNDLNLNSIEWESCQIIEGRHVLLLISVSKAKIKQPIIIDSSKKYYCRVGEATIAANKIIQKKWSLEDGRSQLKRLDGVECSIIEFFHEHEKVTLSLLYKNFPEKNNIVDSALAQLLYKETVQIIENNETITYSLL